jgi:fructose-bisphosphate aldolase class II
MLTNIRTILNRALESGYAVGAFNTVNLETSRAIIEAAQERRSPVIIQMTEKTLDYAGGRAMYHLVKNLAEFYIPEIPVAVHLDHGKSFEVVQRVIEIGFPSVMYDGSRKVYADNMNMTKQIVEYAHERGVIVQGELGNVPYLGEMPMEDLDWDKYMTDPEQAAEFVTETKVDTLAVAIGNAHGFFRERGEPDYDRLSAIAKRVSLPIVLHGASDWGEDRAKEVIKRGVACFNVDTAIRLSFLGRLRQNFEESEETDLRKVMGAAKDAAKETIMEKMDFYGSSGRADAK